MALSAGIEYRRLTVSVNLVHITAALLHKIIDKLHLAFSRCVVESGLIKIIRLVRAYTHLSKDTGHPDSLVISLNQCGGKHRGLLVVCFVKELTHIITMSLVLLHDLVNISILD